MCIIFISFTGKTIQVKSLENVCEILNKVAKKADELLSNPKVGYPFQPFTPEATKAWKEMIKAVDKVNQGQPKKEQRVFQMLLIHVGFQLFSTDVNGECRFLGKLWDFGANFMKHFHSVEIS